MYHVRLTLEEVFLSADSGVILPVHLFGPIFGACCSLVLSLGGRSASPAPSSSSPFPLVGASLLLVSLPVTNGIASESDAEMTRAVVNTLLATAAAASTSIAVAIAYSHIRSPTLLHSLLTACKSRKGIFFKGRSRCPPRPSSTAPWSAEASQWAAPPP